MIFSYVHFYHTPFKDVLSMRLGDFLSGLDCMERLRARDRLEEAEIALCGSMDPSKVMQQIQEKYSERTMSSAQKLNEEKKKERMEKMRERGFFL